MPNSFVTTDDGLTLIADGIGEVLRWPGRGTASPAGLPRPGAGGTITPGGTGEIGGDPFVPEVLSPSGLVVEVPAQEATFVDYVAYVRWVDGDGNVSDLGPPIGPVPVSAAGMLTYTGLPTADDPRIVARQILRNTGGQLTTFYVDLEDAGLLPVPAGLWSDKTDEVLAAQPAVPLFTDGGFPLANSHARPPDHHPVLASHLGRVFAAGVAVYAEGSVALTGYSATVTGTGTEWPATFAGRFLHIDGHRPVEIASCDPAAQTLTLLAPWPGSTSPFASYSIRPAPALGRALSYSNAGEPESWPAYQQVALKEDGDVVTALLPFGSFLFVMKERSMYRLSAQSDPGRDGFLFEAGRRGCLSHRTWVIADEVAYVMDRQGVYAFSGGQPQDVSGPVQALFRDADGPRINFAAARWFHAAASPAEQAVRFFVSLAGERLPRHALVYGYRVQKWWVEKYAEPVGASCVARLGRPGGWSQGDDRVLLGGGADRVLAADAGPTDVAAPLAGPVASATAATLTATAARFPDLAGVPVAIRSGRGAGQVRVVTANTRTRLTLDRPWAVRPDATSEYLVGGIACRADFAAVRLAPSEDREGCSAEVRHRPSKDSRAALEVAYDFAGRADRARPPAAGESVPLDSPDGATLVRLDRHRELGSGGRRFVRLSVAGVSGGQPLAVGELLLNGVV